MFASLSCFSLYAVWILFNKYRTEGFDNDSSDDEDDGVDADEKADARARITGPSTQPSKSSSRGGSVPESPAGNASKGSKGSATTQRRAKRS